MNRRNNIRSVVLPAIMGLGLFATSGCSDSYERAELEVQSHVIEGNSAHFGITGQVSREGSDFNLVAHSKFTCLERGVLPPFVNIRTHTLIGNRHRHETLRQIKASKEMSCSAYLLSITEEQAEQEFDQAVTSEHRNDFGTGYWVPYKELDEFREELLKDAANGNDI